MKQPSRQAGMCVYTYVCVCIHVCVCVCLYGLEIVLLCQHLRRDVVEGSGTVEVASMDHRCLETLMEEAAH